MTSTDIRQAFFDYFLSKGHEVLPSSSLVPSNDPTLMFVNAGMVPFKNIFTGKEPRKFKRAVTSQKCIRISGKHNDLENVGVTARHHTFFEMLGNFSFGDYFKEQAIEYGWEFVTRVLGLPKERLIATVFAGEEGLPADEEAAKLWKRISGLPDNRILQMGAADNFWQMGDTGPCGPCSEIHIYLGEGEPNLERFGQEPDERGHGWIELWNLVFMQFDRQQDGTLIPLPAPSIDTGMGLERATAVKQGVLSNYDTDLLRPIVDLASTLSKHPYTGGQSIYDVGMRVIADHARTTAFLIAEGVFPDRDGRAYVLRRVMRRAIRFGHRIGIDKPFLHTCALSVVDLMGNAYPELVEFRATIEEITKQEEERFRATLKRGLELLESNTEWDKSENGHKRLPGSTSFLLYDTFGFPLDLQEVIGKEHGFEIDHNAFDAELQKAKERSAGSKVGDKAVGDTYREVAAKISGIEFVGYQSEQCESDILVLLKKGQIVDRLNEGDLGEIIVRKTPFYGESGGQVGDQGVIKSQHGLFCVEDTQKPLDGFFVHLGRVTRGRFSKGESVSLEVNHTLREATRRNHSATHLLHYALRKVLGPQATQKGSLVGPERLRFDYSASKPLEASQILDIENLVNEKVFLNAPVETEVLGYDEAKKKGAMGIFEEKYGDVVRMLRMTDDSIELCGGTHASRTGDIGLFKILSDSGLAAGVRRIEAATATNALRYFREVERELNQAAHSLKSRPLETANRAEKILQENKQLGKEIERLNRKLISGGSSDLSADAKQVGNIRVLGALVDVGDAGALRELAESLRDKMAPSVVLLGTPSSDGRALLVCTVSKDLTSRFSAGNLIKQAAQLVGGGGGGRPDFAQAGGSDPSKLQEAVQTVYAAIS